MSVLISLFAVAIVLAMILVITGYAVSRLYRKVEQGQALVVNRVKQVDVTFTGTLVLPVMHRAELMDVSVKRLNLDRRGSAEALICKDNIRADIGVSFYVRVNPTPESVLEVARLIGCSEASNIDTLGDLFTAKFSEALKTVGKQMDFRELYDLRDQFRARVIEVIGNDLNGYSLDDVAIEYLEQTPLSDLDPNNIFDAEGIRLITEITAREAVVTNELSRDAEKATRGKDVETAQAIFELDRQEKAAEFRANRMVATTKAEEEAAAKIVEADKAREAEEARLAAAEAVGVRGENKDREVELANAARRRAVVVEDERVIEAQALAAASREAETAKSGLAVEASRTELAQRTAERTEADRLVAEREESIATLRVEEDARRQKAAQVLGAEADAEADQVIMIKAAAAAETAAAHRASEVVRLAEAEREAATHRAEAARAEAEGSRATTAAPGLAEAEVRRATAAAEADGERLLGEARAASTSAVGSAEGQATRDRLLGEAAGITEKAKAMTLLEGVGQQHEEFIRQLDADTQVRLADVGARRDAAVAHATAMGEALAAANIDIVGGSDVFVDKVLAAANTGRQLDSLIGGSVNLSGVAQPYVDGSRDLPALIAGAVGGLGTDGLRDLTLAGLLHRLSGSVGGNANGFITEVIDALKAQGLDQMPVGNLINATAAPAAEG